MQAVRDIMTTSLVTLNHEVNSDPCLAELIAGVINTIWRCVGLMLIASTLISTTTGARGLEIY